MCRKPDQRNDIRNTKQLIDQYSSAEKNYQAHPDKDSQYYLPSSDKLTEPGTIPAHPLLNEP
jgi:hypothetical protein